jgi:hypothetical protein
MRPSVPVTRARQLADHLLLPGLALCLCAAVAGAAPGTWHEVRWHPAKAAAAVPSCGTSLTLRALQRQARSLAGPVARRSTTPHAGLRLPGPLLTRGSHGRPSDEDAAIANDTLVARIEDEGVQPGLRALGLLVSSLDPLPASRVFSPRSSRGPPGLV